MATLATDSGTRPERRPLARRALVLPAVAGVLAAVAMRLPHLWDVTLFDVDAYLTVGQQWWNGDVPYRDLFDNKGPFLFELFAVLSQVLPRSLVSVYAFGLVVFSLSVWQLAVLAGRHLGAVGTWCAAVAYGVAGSAVVFQGQEPNSDQLAMLGVVASIDFADRYRAGGLRRWALAAGVALALAAGIKASYLIVLPIVAVLILIRPGRRVAAAVAAGASLLVVSALTLLPFAIEGALGDVRFVLVDYTDRYVSAGFDAVAALDWPGRLAWLTTFPAFPLLLAGIVLGVVAWRRPETRFVALLGAAWLVAAWVLSRSTGRSYPHYFVGMAPPLALLIGAGVQALADRAPQVRAAVAALALAAACGPLAVQNWRAVLEIPASSRHGDLPVAPLRSVDEAAAFVRRTTEPGDRVFVVTGGATTGGLFLYWLADRGPAHRIFYPGEVVPPRYAEVSAAFRERPPAALIRIPGTDVAPYRAVIEDEGMEVVARFPGLPGDDLEVYAKPGAG